MTNERAEVGRGRPVKLFSFVFFFLPNPIIGRVSIEVGQLFLFVLAVDGFCELLTLAFVVLADA